ncbi:hypothetical protein [Oceanibaculum indicum]|uniref:hypothetical protein n=1 Tax=Oceanibaculum indicum TaxID=526216 RepID=UPI0012EAF600|nr:hypothetical protein [Oceanibaculum indicum]
MLPVAEIANRHLLETALRAIEYGGIKASHTSLSHDERAEALASGLRCLVLAGQAGCRPDDAEGQGDE